MFTNLTATCSLACQLLLELRDKNIQQNRGRFCRNLERLGEIAAYEISKKLRYEKCTVETPLGQAPSMRLAAHPVVATILRAGIPLQQGMVHFFDQAHSAFVSAYRKHDERGGFEIAVEYLSCPSLTDRILIICDPMLATGRSMVEVIKGLLKNGTPGEIHILSVVSTQTGLDYVHKSFPQANLWTFAVDPELNERAYIVPGLGDAGDLAFGAKIQR